MYLHISNNTNYLNKSFYKQTNIDNYSLEFSNNVSNQNKRLQNKI